MRLHRLRLSDFRGIEEREVVFADHGVTVVEGANEVGKSSMIEALDLLLERRSDSRSAAVRSIAPAGRDVGSVVEAEISCGDYTFVYRKQFNRAHRTELSVLSPRTQQLSGREADQWVQRVLADEVDMSLYAALRLVQGVAAEPTSLAGSSALSRALDAAAAPELGGGPAVISDDAGAGSGLLGAAIAEHERYYTPGLGKPARELADALAAVESARELMEQRRRAFDEACDDMVALDDAVARQSELARTHELARVELVQLDQRLAAAAEVVRRRDTARADLAVGQARADAAARSDTHRRRLQQHHDDLAEQLQRSEIRLSELTGAVAECAAEAEALVADLNGTRAELADAEAAVLAARDAERRRAAADQVQRLSTLIDRADALVAERDASRERLSRLPIDESVLSRLTELATAEAIARAAKDAAAPGLRVEQLGAEDVLVNGESLCGTAELAVSAATEITVDGVISVQVTPGPDVQERDREHARAAEALAAALAEFDVADLSAAQASALERSRVQRAVDDLRIEIDAVLDGRELSDIRADLADATIRAEVTGVAEPAEADLDPVAAQERCAAARDQLDALQGRREQLSVQQAALSGQVEMLEQQRDNQHAALGAAQEELSTAEAESADEPVDLAAERQRLAEIESELAALDVDSAALHRDNVADVVADGTERLAALAARVTELSTRVEVRAAEGRFDQLSTAEAELAAAEDHLRRVQGRAEAARVLLGALTRHRDDARNRYVRPFTDAVERLGRVVFGSSFAVEIDQELQVVSRTLDGITVPLDSLSGGAKEQLGIIVRLACAMVVDPADGVPVIIDDALGYTDPDRLETVGAVLRHAGRDCQIIVLTCTPDRYRAVGGAHLVSL
ncbi:AAA family ATPase [Jongsikchunia kroppenstedtii]|uniref:AAA family ATPase n=1 Tax=Jongsikchunia kroppenstedtii TaxID=1121721 RepID=UPI0003767C0C|nr:AAA family ATPase [Jongsikchunia kroppenstedtii]